MKLLVVKDMSTPKTSKELFDSLHELRSDPLIAAVLRGDGAVHADRAQRPPSNGHSSPPTRSSYLASHPHRTSSPTPADLQNVALAHESSQFLRNRDASRASVGVSNWVQNHRGEVDAAEVRRVENRLKAERTFAQTQLDVEKFRLEHHRPSSHQVDHQMNKGGQEVRASDGSVGARDDNSPAKETQTTPEEVALAPRQTYEDVASHPSGASPVPMRPLVSGSTAPIHHYAGGSMHSVMPLGAFSPLYQEMQRFNSTASPQLNTDDAFGPVNEEENYRAKAADSRQIREDNGALNSQANRHNHVDDLFGRNTEIDALKTAVEQRDRTIHRLERQLAQDRDYYEQQIQRLKAESHEERIGAEGRVTALRAQIDQLISSRAGRNAHETTIEDMTIKLQAVQRMYRESVDDIRRAAVEKSEDLERTCEARVNEITQRAEAAIREAKEVYRVERSDYLTAQKERLVDLVQREQQLLLREAEASLKDVVEASVKEKLVTEMECAFRKHLQADVLPALRDQMRLDATAEVLKEATTSAEGIFSGKALELRNLLQLHCCDLETNMIARFKVSAEQILSNVHNTQHAVPSEIANGEHAISITSNASALLRQSQRGLDEALAKTVAEDERQKRMEDLHGEKMEVYRRRMEQIEEALDSEKRFADAIRQQVSQVSSSGAATLHRGKPVMKEDQPVPPPWVAAQPL